MSSVKLVLDVGVQFIPGVGRVLDAGLGTCRHNKLNISFDVANRLT